METEVQGLHIDIFRHLNDKNTRESVLVKFLIKINSHQGRKISGGLNCPRQAEFE